jgi:hypothetical protein
MHQRISSPRKSVVIYQKKDYESVVTPSPIPSKHRGSLAGIYDEMDLKKMILEENAEDESTKKAASLYQSA